MKKFLTVVAAGILIIIALASLGNLVALAIGAGIAYWSFTSFMKAETLLGKFSWGIIGLIGLAIVFGNFPAIIGIGAIALLYYGYREWKKDRCYEADHKSDSFSNFEDEWKKVMR
ncbi:hypothetical protein ACFDTO_16475 [Microbacteriaceae bacterium 4G12]